MVVEHEEAVLRAADHVVEIGPGRGALTRHILDRQPGRLVVLEKDDDLAQALRLAVHVVADFAHQPGTISPHDGRQRRIGKDRADARIDDRGQADIGPGHTVDALVEAQRIDDPVARESVNDEPLLVGGDHLLLRQFEIEDTLVDRHDIFNEGHLEIEPRRGDRRPGYAAKAEHERLLRLLHDKNRREQQHKTREDDNPRYKTAGRAHFTPPAGFFCNSPSGR